MSKQRGKRNVAFIKPEEPNFLKRIKQQIGYREPEEEIDAKVKYFTLTALSCIINLKPETHVSFVIILNKF